MRVVLEADCEHGLMEKHCEHGDTDTHIYPHPTERGACAVTCTGGVRRIDEVSDLDHVWYCPVHEQIARDVDTCLDSEIDSDAWGGCRIESRLLVVGLSDEVTA